MKILENINLAEYTTFKVGGKARYFCVVKSEKELSGALFFAREKDLQIFVLGGGSNVLVGDAGFGGLVIKMEMMGVSFEDEDKSDGGDVSVTAWAGENWDEFVAKTVEWNLWGIENLSGIPGTVGASPVQNIGAYGTEVKDFISEVRTIDFVDQSVKVFKNSECLFGYRDSFFKKPEGKKYVITGVTFKLSKIPKPNLTYKDLKTYFSSSSPSLSEIREAVIKIRMGKFPDLSVVGTAGSFWKNPIVSKEHFAELLAKYPNMPSFLFGDQIKIPLAWILDNVCNLKGYSKGPVNLWKNQPLVVVAEKGATESLVSNFVGEIKSLVKQKTGIEIDREVGSL